MTYISEKLYYTNPFHLRAKTLFEKRADYFIALERSIAYPEGGGQLSDIGTVTFEERNFPFSDTKKVAGKGRTVIRKDFPIINVEGEIQIKLLPEDFVSLPENGEIIVKIDRDFRSALCISHTISHLVYMAMTELRPAVPEHTQGCLITKEGGRFDVSVEKYFPEDVTFIKGFVDDLLNSKKEITITEIKGEPECRIWNLGVIAIPCGGTHLDSLFPAGDVLIKRKGKSKGLERIYYEVSNLNLEPYCSRFINALI